MYNYKDLEKICQIIEHSPVVCNPTKIGNLHTARTAIKLNLKPDEDSLIIVGSACDESAENAKFIARQECKERAFSIFDFRSITSNEYDAYSIKSKMVVSRFKAQDVLFASGNDSVGLSLHVTRELAIQHAALEVIERAVLAKIFYQNAPLALIASEKIDSITIRYYTIADIENSGFTLAILTNSDNSIMTLGASQKADYAQSMKKARSEAIMLADNILCEKKITHIMNAASRSRLESQTNRSLNLKRITYFETICIGEVESSRKCFRLDDMIDFCGSDIQYCNLIEQPDVFLVRAKGIHFKNLASYRATESDSVFYQIDFVC